MISKKRISQNYWATKSNAKKVRIKKTSRWWNHTLYVLNQLHGVCGLHMHVEGSMYKKFDKNWNRKQYSLDYFSTGNFPFVVPNDSFFPFIFRLFRIYFVNILTIFFLRANTSYSDYTFDFQQITFDWKRICVSVKCYS